MSADQIDRHVGRSAFGLDPSGYHKSRPGYPEWVYQTLHSRCGLDHGTTMFEVGAGTGTATRRLLDLGADPLVAVEPDARLAEFLRRNNPDRSLKVLVSGFEAAELADAAFDLGVGATSVHWLEEEAALEKIARLLRPGGWWAAFWNVFGDDSRPDPFHLATMDLLGGPLSPSVGDRGVPFALDADARLAALKRTGAFDVVDARMSTWSLVLDATEVVALYRTYSNVSIRDDREAVLTELGRIAREMFADRVVRNMTTSLYLARRAL
jgi:SAM-dependent methyltransferase